MAEGEFTPEYEVKESKIDYNFDVSLAPCDNQNAFEFYRKADKPFNVIHFDEKPDFSGVVKFETEFNADELGEKVILDFGRVGGVATVILNDKEYATLICNPYTLDVTDSIKQGKNKLIVKVAGAPTALYIEDADPRWRSSYIPGRPVGLLSDVKLVVKNKK